MEPPDILKSLGVTPEAIAGIKQGPGILGKLTTIALAAITLFAIALVVGGVMHSLAIILIGLVAAIVLPCLAFLGIAYVAHRFPTQSLEGLALVLDRHPEVLGKYLSKFQEPSIDTSFRDEETELQGSNKQPALLEDSSPDAPEVTDTEEVK